MTDADFMLAVLSERPGEWISQRYILDRSEQTRRCGLTPHSRASDLRNRGHIIENKTERIGTRAVSYYRLVTASLSTPPGQPGAPLSPASTLLPGGVESEDLARPGGTSADREPSHSSESEDLSLNSVEGAGIGAGGELRTGSLTPDLNTPPSTLFDEEPATRRAPAWA